MAYIHRESFVVQTVGDCSKKDTLPELVCINCADDGVVVVFADMSLSGFKLVPDIVLKTDERV